MTDVRAVIQAEIDSLGDDGGEIYLPAGVHDLGTPGASDNFPLLLGSNITFRGAGRGRTILRVCADARQVPRNPGTYFARSACAITTKSSLWWLGANALPQVSGIRLEDITLDGSKNEQPEIYVPGNRTTAPVVLNPSRSFGPDGRLESVRAVPGGVLPPGEYFVCVTYRDTLGNETACTAEDAFYADVPADGGSWAIEIVPRPPPSGSVSMVVYIRELNDFYNGNRVYQRWPVEGLPAKITIPAHAPNGMEMPPGYGVLEYHGNSGSSCGLYLERCSDVELVRVELRNFVLEGVMHNEGPVSDVRMERVWIHGCGRHAISLTGEARGVDLERCVLEDCGSCGLDFEAGQPITNVTLRNVTIRRVGTGINLSAPKPAASTRAVHLENCTIEDVAILFRVTAKEGARHEDVRIQGCSFGYAASIGIQTYAPGDGVIEGCRFDRVIRGPGYQPDRYGVRNEANIELGGGPESRWKVTGNTFLPYREGTSVPTYPLIHVVGPAKNHLIAQNHMDRVEGVGAQALVWADGSVLSDHVVRDNTGGGEMMED